MHATRSLMSKSPDAANQPGEDGVCALLSLPPEVVHLVFEYLDVDDVATARLACRTLATFGDEYLLSGVYLFYKLDRFHRLEQIASRPIISKKVRSLCYHGDRMSEYPTVGKWLQSIETTKAFRKQQIGKGWNALPRESLPARLRRACWEGSTEIKRWTEKDKVLWRAYQSYKRLLAEQEQLHKDQVDVRCLTAFFRGCSNLEDVLLVFDHEVRDREDLKRIAFSEARMNPYGDVRDLSAGIEHINSICVALCNANLHLRRFTASSIGYKFLGHDPERLLLLQKALCKLQSFRLDIGTPDEYETYAEEVEDSDFDLVEDMEATICSPTLHELITAMPDLRNLKLLLTADPRFGDEGLMDLQNVFGSFAWPKLRELGISHMTATEDDFASLLLKHAPKLRRLSLSHIHLTTGNWKSLFRRVAGKFPVLREIRLNGYFYNQESLRFRRCGEFSFGVPSIFERYEVRKKLVLQDYIMKGGSYPDIDAAVEELELADEEAAYDMHSESEYGSDGEHVHYTADDFDTMM